MLNESTENKSSLPLPSSCLVSFEFVNREKHLVEIVELPRSFQRISRMNIYKKIHQRLVLMNLINIDLTALLRTILQSFP
jgi:vesicle coat complex subunit